MRTFELLAPAKINLGLRVTGVREDGYHLLDSWFVPLDLADGLRLQVDPERDAGVSLELTGQHAKGIPNTMENLAAQAAGRFLATAGQRAHVEIGLEKRIPAGAGLGGGSSDAAAVLRGLDRCFPGAVSREELSGVALGLGADVPFFLDPRPARVRGIGETIDPLVDLPELALVVATPGISLATADVYAEWDAVEGALTENAPRPTMPAAFGTGFDSGALERLTKNDLEPPASRLCPAITSLQSELRSLGALAVGMSGSGSAVFGIFPDLSLAEIAREAGRFEMKGAAGFEAWSEVVRTVSSAA